MCSLDLVTASSSAHIYVVRKSVYYQSMAKKSNVSAIASLVASLSIPFFMKFGNSFESDRRRLLIFHITSSSFCSINSVILFAVDFGPLDGITQPSGCFPLEARTKIRCFGFAEARRRFRY